MPRITGGRITPGTGQVTFLEDDTPVSVVAEDTPAVPETAPFTLTVVNVGLGTAIFVDTSGTPHHVIMRFKTLLAGDGIAITDDGQTITIRGDRSSGISSAFVDGNGDLVIVTSEGTQIVAGHVVGPAGADGAAGANGVDGAPGQAGTPGSVWHTGTTSPSSSLGANADFYLNVSNGNVYQKTGGSWLLQGNIKGPAGVDGTDGVDGAPGSVWHTGSSAPGGAVGTDGDLYLDVTTGDVHQKTAGSWLLVGNIKGPAGQDAVFPPQPYDVGLFLPGKPAADALMMQHVAPRAYTIAAGASGSAYAGTAATGSPVITIKHNGTQVGTITFALGSSTGVVDFVTSVTTVAGDRITLHAPAAQDATLADVSVTLMASR